ncbi:MAG: dihydropteridine reductase [Bacillota bacterium]|nr:dihydropteridine reductase [Bacillota bacterium]
MNIDRIYAESIAKEYAPKGTSKIVALRKLDRKAKLPANIFAYTFGTISALIAGTGMCLSMGVLGEGKYMIIGIIIGLLGFVGAGVNYPVYKNLLEKGKQKYAFEIIELAKQISDR